MWKKAIVACFKVLTEHLTGGTEENHEHKTAVFYLGFNPGTS
jgi:hypothetical protein